MESSVHRQLKAVYAERGAQQEVVLDGYRIDVVCGDELIEIQHGPLAAIRDKVRRLADQHRVRVVKPIVASKVIVKLDGPSGSPISRRRSPKRCNIWDLFHDLIHFTHAFPHPNLTLEAPLIHVEELRFPGHGRRRRWRRTDHQVQDQRLLSVERVYRFCGVRDVLRLLPATLKSPFHTGQLAASVDLPRWHAQRVAYALKKMRAIEEVGKSGNSRLYRR